MNKEELEDNKEAFLKLKTNQPKPGDILTSAEGQPVELSYGSRTEGGVAKEAVFCRAIVDVKRGGWFLEGGNRGIICLILPQAQKRLCKFGNTYLVEKLEVVRYTENGRSMLCEVR